MAKIEFEGVRRKLHAIGARLDESLTQFLEPTKFVHAAGCMNIQLTRTVEREGNISTTTRRCESCGASDSFKIDYSSFEGFRWG